MKRIGIYLLSITLLMQFGCAISKKPPTSGKQPSVVRKSVPRRVWTAKQLDVLRSFALSESPQLWQTAQTLKSEKAVRKAALDALCEEMKEFDRNPDSDPDVAELRSACADLDGTLTTIYIKLEEAYIAYKKMQTTPGRKEYADIMRAALEDGIQEADTTAARYREMSRSK